MLALPRCLGAALLLAACGTSGASGTESKSAANSDAAASPPESDASREREEAEPPPAASPKSSGPDCEDGTCSRCGSGICPRGWYCDERASGGQACSWLAECAEKASCACVKRVLGAGCQCREEGGGIKVACD